MHNDLGRAAAMMRTVLRALVAVSRAPGPLGPVITTPAPNGYNAGAYRTRHARSLPLRMWARIARYAVDDWDALSPAQGQRLALHAVRPDKLGCPPGRVLEEVGCLAYE